MRKPFKVVVTDFITEPLDIEREILGEVAEVVALGANTEADFKNSLRQVSVAGQACEPSRCLAQGAFL